MAPFRLIAALDIHRLLARLTLRGKLVIISAMCAVPIVLLTGFLIAQTREDMLLAANERSGSTYLAAVWPAFVNAAAVDSMRIVDGSKLDAIDKASIQFGQGMASTAAVNDFTNALRHGKSSRETVSMGKLAIQKIGDDANLTLDPQLDSYYLMDVVVFRLPELLAAAQSVNRTAQALADKQMPSFADRAELVRAIGRFDGAVMPLARSFATALTANRNGILEKQLAALVSRHAQIMSTFQESENQISELSAQNLPLTPALLGTSADFAGLLAATNQLWESSNTALSQLLEKRIADLLFWTILQLSVVGFVLLLTALMMAIVAWSIQDPIKTLISLMHRLRQGDTAFHTPFAEARNEVGDIARAMEDFRRTAQELSQSRLQRDIQQQAAAARATELGAIAIKVRDVVDAARAGDFRRRVTTDATDSFVKELADGVNDLTATVDRGLSETLRILSAMADGDLTQRIEGEFAGSFLTLKTDANRMGDQIRGIVGRIAEASQSVEAAMLEIGTGVADLSVRTEQQASALEETNASMEEMSVSVRQNASNARAASQAATATRLLAVKSGEIANEAVAAMTQIEGSSQQITAIIELIEEIAFQTNILALNASVEAARAGNAGHGFGVVAQEVRALSQRSAQALKDIRAQILTSNASVKIGVKRVRNAGQALSDIVTSVGDVARLISEIDAASHEQATGVELVSSAMSHMDDMTQQNAALVEETNTTLNAAQSQVANLVDAVATFKTGAPLGRRSAPARWQRETPGRRPALAG